MTTADYIRHQFEFRLTSNDRLLDVIAGMREARYPGDNGI
jgi:hypothetical protein